MQYTKLCTFAELGCVKNSYVRQSMYIILINRMVLYAVYNEKHYRDLVYEAAEKSMLAAVQEVKALPHYESKGEVRTFMFVKCITMPFQWVITDARHDSTANAYHTTVPCLSGR